MGNDMKSDLCAQPQIALLNVFVICRLFFQATAIGSSSVNAAGKNAVVTSLMVCCGFVACYTLNEVFFFVNLIHHAIDFSGWLYHFSVVLVMANSCINPFIYAAKHRKAGSTTSLHQLLCHFIRATT